MNTITIKGQSIPCYKTMGAYLKYKELTGTEVSAMKGDITELVTYLYCLCSSASAAEGSPLAASLQEFADSLPLDDFNAWVAAFLEESAEAAKAAEPKQKKTKKA